MYEFQRQDDYIVCTGFPGEEHSLKEFVTPNQIMVRELYERIAEGSADVAWDCWSWICTQIRYPKDWLGRFRDVHELNAFGLRRIRSTGEFFQLPYQTLVVRIGDCFDTSSLLASLLRNVLSDVYVVVGKYKGQGVINHAWVIANGKHVMETTLAAPNGWKTMEELPEYEPEIIFSDHEIYSRGETDHLFCHPDTISAHVRGEIARCWGC